MADNQITLLASQDSHSDRSTNSNSSGSIGVSVGANTGITASVSQGKGHSNSDDVSYNNTHIAAGNTVTLQSGGDTHLKGAVVSGKQVIADVGGDLKIESLQDSSRFEGKQQSSGGSITLSPAGVPIGGSINAGQSKVNSHYQSVTEQSGIQAGDGGFQVSVKGDTDLKGGVIASTQAAVDQDKNRFSTGGTLTTSDLHNSAHYEGQAIGVNVNTGQQGGKHVVNGVGAGVGQDSGSAQGSTTAGISGIAGDQSLRTGDATGIERIFDQNKVQRDIDAQVAITAEFGKQASKGWGDYANEQFAKAVAATDEEGARCWGPDGACRAGGHALVGGLGGGVAGAAGAGLSSVMAPQVQQALVNSGIAPNAAQAITQLTVIGSGAAMGGALGAAGAANEVNNNFVFAVPVIVEGVIAGGALAARACLSSPACVRALQLGGAALVAKVAAILTPDEIATIPGFAAGDRPQPIAILVNPLPDPSKIKNKYGAPPLNSPDELKKWLNNILEGYPSDQAEKWAKDLVRTLPISEQVTYGDLIVSSVKNNSSSPANNASKVNPKNLSDIWSKNSTDRGNAIESYLSTTDYKEWFNIGQLNDGKFPLVDFQKDNVLVSLKTVDTSGSTWMDRMQAHIYDLGSNGQPLMEFLQKWCLI